jgi:alpha-D-xyloside xylohydrolase
MRFGDGAWRMLDDVIPTYLSRVDALRIEPKSLLLHVSSRLEEARWATLEGHMFTVRITSPMPSVFRIEVGHHQGRRRNGPTYRLASEPQLLPSVSDDGDTVSVLSGRVRLVITKKPYQLVFTDAETGEPITQSPAKGCGLMEKLGHGLFVREQLALGVGELVYGLGERFAAFCRNGQVVDMWNSDCGTCSDKGYKDVPFFLSSRGYGVLVNSSGRVSFEIGTEQVTRAQFAAPGEELDYFLLFGPTPKEVLTRLGALSGRPALPPAWSFGLWLTTSFTTDYDEPTVMSFVDGMRERNLPLHVFHFDCFWMKGHHWSNFEWDPDVFPDPEGMLERLAQRGIRICVWINPYIGERSHLFAEGRDHAYLLVRQNGDVYQRDRWQAGMGYVDFTNPDATRWFQEKLRRLLRMGVDCFKTDFGEEIPTDVVYSDGSDPERMHNYYPYLYNKAVFDLLLEERGRGEAVLFARSATATCQQFPVHWGGDCYGTYESMAESLRGGLSLTLSGFAFWSHDIGGFESKASPGVYKRWVAFGLLSSHSRLHGSTSYRVPWLYDEEAVDVLRRFTELKCRLMPYLMAAAVRGHETNVPMMRAMLLEFPQDLGCRTLDRQYMLGSELLVAPVFDDRHAEYYLPEGEWLHLLTGERKTGGRWLKEDFDFFGLPLYLRPGGVVAMGKNTQAVEYDYEAGVRLVMGLRGAPGTREVSLVDTKGTRTAAFLVEDHPGRVCVTHQKGRTDFELQLPWTAEVTVVEGGKVVPPTPAGTRLVGDPGGAVVRATAPRVVVEWSSPKWARDPSDFRPD